MTWNSSQYNQVWNAVFNPISGLPTPDEQLQSNFHLSEEELPLDEFLETTNSAERIERLYELLAEQEQEETND
jgi:hypothetical protein